MSLESAERDALEALDFRLRTLLPEDYQGDILVIHESAKFLRKPAGGC